MCKRKIVKIEILNICSRMLISVKCYFQLMMRFLEIFHVYQAYFVWVCATNNLLDWIASGIWWPNRKTKLRNLFGKRFVSVGSFIKTVFLIIWIDKEYCLCFDLNLFEKKKQFFLCCIDCFLFDTFELIKEQKVKNDRVVEVL